MSAADETRNAWRQAALELARRNGASAWLAASRQAGLDSYDRLGFPTTRDEAWRFTNVAPILKTADGDSDTGNPVSPTQYDDELLNRHFITGDGRGNEKNRLTAVHRSPSTVDRPPPPPPTKFLHHRPLPAYNHWRPASARAHHRPHPGSLGFAGRGLRTDLRFMQQLAESEKPPARSTRRPICDGVLPTCFAASSPISRTESPT